MNRSVGMRVTVFCAALLLLHGGNAGGSENSFFESVFPIGLMQRLRSSPAIDPIDSLESGGRAVQADSLLRMLDSAGPLGPDLLLRWARIKTTIGHYSGASGIYCRLLAADARMLEMVLGQLHPSLDMVPADTIAAALGVLYRCALDRRGIDTLRLQLGLADLYGRLGMEIAELQMLASISSPAPELVPRLLSMAREHHNRGAHGKAVPPARMAFHRAANGNEKTAAAEALFLAYRSLCKSDSAIVWLTRAGIADDKRRIDAAALYQSTGKLAEAQKIIEAIAPSFGRDTIELRQRLFGGDTKGAVRLAKKKAGSWVQGSGDGLLWRIRTLLFDGAFDEMQSLFDSGSVDPAWTGAKDLLDCHYFLRLFNGSPPALSVWSRIDYDIYTGNARRAAERFVGQRLSPEFRETLQLRIVKELLARGDAASASLFFAQPGETGESPEYFYIRALVELANGREAEARKYLLRVIGDFPEDVFSEKARIALLELRGKS